MMDQSVHMANYYDIIDYRAPKTQRDVNTEKDDSGNSSNHPIVQQSSECPLGELQCSNAGGSQSDGSVKFRASYYSNEQNVFMFGFGTCVTIAVAGVIVFLVALILQITFFSGAALGSVSWSVADFIISQYTTSVSLRTILTSYYQSIGSPK